VSKICVTTECMPINIQNSEATKFGQSQGGPLVAVTENGIQGVQSLETGKNGI